MKLLDYIRENNLGFITQKRVERTLRKPADRQDTNAQETIRTPTIMNDSRENLVQVLRSSGKKEWMTREKLAELNKQRALKRKKAEKPVKQHWNGLKA